MKVIKLSKPSFSKWKIDLPNGNYKYRPAMSAGEENDEKSLSQVLNNLTQRNLCEVIEKLEKVEITTKEAEKLERDTFEVDEKGNDILIPFSEWENGYFDDYVEILTGKSTVSWSDGDSGAGALSYKDLTFVGLTPNTTWQESDIYSTPEVLQVLKQWKAYLEKFEAEKEEKEKKKDWKFWKQ